MILQCHLSGRYSNELYPPQTTPVSLPILQRKNWGTEETAWDFQGISLLEPIEIKRNQDFKQGLNPK